LRQPLIFYLAKDIPSNQSVKIFKCSESLIKLARQLSEDQIQQTLLFVRKYQRKKQNIGRAAKSNSSKKFLENFVCLPLER
jgi:hypothetical protein